VDKQEIRNLFKFTSLRLDKLSENTKQTVKGMELGCCVLRVDPIKDPNASEYENLLFAQTLHFKAWKGKNSVSLFVNKDELKSICNMYLSENYSYSPQQDNIPTDKQDLDVEVTASN